MGKGRRLEESDVISIDAYEVSRVLRSVAEDVLAGTPLPAGDVVAEARRLIPAAIRALEEGVPEEVHALLTSDVVAMAAVAMAAERWGYSLWEYLPLP